MQVEMVNKKENIITIIVTAESLGREEKELISTVIFSALEKDLNIMSFYSLDKGTKYILNISGILNKINDFYEKLLKKFA